MPTLAMAQSQASAASTDQVAATETQTPGAAVSETWGDKSVPANFVRSKEPAKDGHAYNWIQMGYASLIMAVMVGFMIWLVRRTPARTVASSK